MENKKFHPSRITFTQNKKNFTDDNVKPYIVCYRPFVAVLFFTLKKSRSITNFELMAIEYFLKIVEKSLKIFRYH